MLTLPLCRRLRPGLLACLAVCAPLTASAEKARVPKPPREASKYPFHDTHAREHVTVAAEPGDTEADRPNTRLDYFHHGFLPMRVIVTNDGDDALVLDDARILFIPAEGGAENAATDEDLQRRLFEMKSVRGTRIPLPSPLPSITIHHKPVDKKISADDDDFGFKSTTVPPHSTVAGYVFYDVRDLDAPVLQRATLEIRKVRYASSNKALDSFEIPLGGGAGSRGADSRQ